jgi:FkbM family methyltransferase
VLTPVHVWKFSDEYLKLFAKERDESPGYPTRSEDVMDNVALLEAVLAADDPFVMTALGAGWGRWITTGAFAARNRGKGYRLVAVEAEPGHFAWLRDHVAENRIDPAHCRLIPAAAGKTNGDCWFYVGKSESWYGQSIVQDSAVGIDPAAARPGDEADYNNERVRRVRCVDIAEVLRDLPPVDYMHLDIQGSEYEFLSARPDLLQGRVKMVNVGTHSTQIEADLRKLFGGLGWVNRLDLTLNEEATVRMAGEQDWTVKFGDGVQVWVNPALSKVTPRYRLVRPA